MILIFSEYSSVYQLILTTSLSEWYLITYCTICSVSCSLRKNH